MTLYNLKKVLFLSVLVSLLSFALNCGLREVGRDGPDYAIDESVLAVTGERKLTEHEERTIAIYRKASPAVVNITSTVLQLDYYRNRIYPVEGAGSGVILTEDGYILTNAHVVRESESIEVTLLNGKSYKARLVGGTLSKDIALLKIDSEEPLPTIEIGNSDDLLVGQSVYAIGNPFGFNSTLTTGIISSVARELPTQNGRLIENVIQTDAAINPGNSGGPLLDSAGRLIGVNTAIISPSGGSLGIGFAIPINVARRVASDLIQHGRVIRSFLGIRVAYEISPPLAQALNLPVDRGLMVANVVEGSPADRAGIQPADKTLRIGNRHLLLGGDIITGYDDREVEYDEEHRAISRFVNYIESRRPGEVVKLKVVRDGRHLTIPVTLQERPGRE